MTPASEHRTLLEEILVGNELSWRELQVLQGAADGETARRTAGRLRLSTETVKTYRRQIVAKLGARNGANAIAIALRRGLIR